jgi:hypothetical protein
MSGDVRSVRLDRGGGYHTAGALDCRPIAQKLSSTPRGGGGNEKLEATGNSTAGASLADSARPREKIPASKQRSKT